MRFFILNSKKNVIANWVARKGEKEIVVIETLIDEVFSLELFHEYFAKQVWIVREAIEKNEPVK
jgi:hypothetical protein